ncbi:hypothetical protein RJ639_041100 [Escallonia herrerae]|uniref:VQ domain-containing protein n=1 Tax=Escallonia herrerae TaxID=1293975 RepID=A0AA88WIB6_9ASTE|nr:hypothetical protein RJ639_041100 [Escallonia herrerae]
MSEARGVKVVIINTQYVETDATSFKSVVQNLTGKDSKVAHEPSSSKQHGRRKQVAAGFGNGVSGTSDGRSVMSRGMSFKDLDRLLMDLPPFDELYRLFRD